MAINNNKNNHETHNPHALPKVSMYLKVFFLLLFLLLVNTGLAQLTCISSHVKLALLLFGAGVQALLVLLFYMELFYENKFYLFILGATLLFIGLFFGITLLELKSRDSFTHLESIDTMRHLDKNALYPSAPAESLSPLSTPH